MQCDGVVCRPRFFKMEKSQTIVVKLGSSSIVDEETREFRIANMALIVETLVKLRRQGHRIVLVSSGAIAVGMKPSGLKQRPEKLSQVQALAAIGQGRLIGIWDDLFRQLDQPIAQILLTRNDISDFTQFKNAENTIQELLSMGVIPVVNENDTLSVHEIKFGDNDTLSAITAGMVHAQYLFLLTDVDCLYTDNPRLNPDAEAIVCVTDIESLNANTESGGSAVGTGGMTTKLIAAELALSAGVTTVICKSDHPQNILEIGKFIQSHSDEDFSNKSEYDRILREKVPLHTRFVVKPDDSIVNSKEFWLLHGLKPKGAVIINNECYQTLFNSSKYGLFPSGVIGVEGNFHQFECVEIKMGGFIGDEVDSSSLVVVGRARCNYTSLEIDKVKGIASSEIENVLGFADSEYVAHRGNLAFFANVHL